MKRITTFLIAFAGLLLVQEPVMAQRGLAMGLHNRFLRRRANLGYPVPSRIRWWAQSFPGYYYGNRTQQRAQVVNSNWYRANNPPLTQTSPVYSQANTISYSPQVQTPVVQSGGHYYSQATPNFSATLVNYPVYSQTGVQPVYSQPMYSQPATSQPVYSQPALTVPMNSQPVYQQPMYSQPTRLQPQSLGLPAANGVVQPGTIIHGPALPSETYGPTF